MILFRSVLPEVFPEDAPAEGEDPVHGVMSAVAVTASIACDAATVLPQDQVRELFQESFDQGGLFSCHGAAATPKKKKPKQGKGRYNRVVKGVLFQKGWSTENIIQDCFSKVIQADSGCCTSSLGLSSTSFVCVAVTLQF